MHFVKQYKKYILLPMFILWAGILYSDLKAQEIHTPNADYHGFRLHLFNIEVLKDNKKFISLRFDLANTGRKDLDISEQKPQPFLTLDFDESLLAAKLGSYRENIRRVLSTSDLKLSVGNLEFRYEIKFSKLLPEDVIKNPTPPKVIAQKDINKRKDSNDIIEKNHDIGEPIFVDKGASCYDFEIDTIIVLEKTEKWITLEYTIKNKGSEGAPMLGKTSSEKDNISIRGYISGVPKMSKGAIVIGGTFISNMPKGEDGVLPSGMKFKSTFKLDIRKKTRYMNNLILSIDPFQTVSECDERNNIYVLKL